ncbi:hypothetical protein HELRODRAFT_166696 [Helobdella robusta]|uniref:Proteasome subunit beta n=1 Tax=Helobdella robusta TaxID=6412 RepID=T1EYD7_HELRO|nr:hypothetical protein HELRODRAFT_166696 [Helobdella robusta]ESO11681.1 hypothetical protein HELRODRAFT_166696 [Helobdella robusta]
MECLVGIKGKDFVLLATDSLMARSIVAMKKDQDKTIKLSDNLLMSVCGGDGDTVQFAEYISKNIQLYRMRNGYDLSTHAAAYFTRRCMAESLRSRTPYFVNLLIAGYDSKDGANLYYMDYLGSLVKVPFATHGYSSFFSLSVMDCHYKPDMTQDEAMKLLQKCVDEITTRFIINLECFKVKIVDKDGIRELPDVKSSFAVSMEA